MNTRAKGRIAEERAVAFLRKKGYEILLRNEVIAGVETDIIALDGDTVVFVEVKSAYGAYPCPAENVTKEKQRRYVRAAKSFAASRSLFDRSIRFDVIEVFDDRMEHIISAFDADAK